MSSRVSTSWCVGRALHISLTVNDWLQVNASGNVVRSEILGAVKMKCYLSGMPELRLGLNDKVMFESTGRSTSPRVGVCAAPQMLTDAFW